ncbi:MAG: hypothetical protein IT577_16730 [Verrucomicrobiae bacterium]|nr:hypothetical protein [Verrucomicrobiae bacterium]
MKRLKGIHEEWFPRFAGRFKRVLLTVILVSAAVHVGGLFLFGSWVVFRHFFYNEARFVVPPELAKTIEPRNLKYKVQLQEQQRRSGRPKIAPRLSARRVSEFSLPDVPVEMSTVERVQSQMKAFGAAGVGAGLGGGSGQGGLGLAASTVKFFGITDRGERIAFLIDISLSMVEDDKGGEAGFKQLKTEIADMIDGLNPGTFFNLILFGNQVDLFEQQMVLASDENKKKAREFLDPYLDGIAESQERSGNILKNYEPSLEGLAAVGGATRMDTGITAGFEQNADVFFIISDGRPHVYKQLEGDELRQLQDRQAKWDEEHDAEKERAERDRAWEAMNAARRKKGLPPKVVELRGGTRPTPPIWTDKEIVAHMEAVGSQAYKDKGRRMPRINCVAFVCHPEEEAFMELLTREFRGKFKRAKARVQAIDE